MDHTHQNPQKVQTERKYKQVKKTDQRPPKQEAKQKKTEILSVISFIEGIMRTLSNYGKRLKNQLDINLIEKEIYLI